MFAAIYIYIHNWRDTAATVVATVVDVGGDTAATVVATVVMWMFFCGQ